MIYFQGGRFIFDQQFIPLYINRNCKVAKLYPFDILFHFKDSLYKGIPNFQGGFSINKSLIQRKSVMEYCFLREKTFPQNYYFMIIPTKLIPDKINGYKIDENFQILLWFSKR